MTGTQEVKEVDISYGHCIIRWTESIVKRLVEKDIPREQVDLTIYQECPRGCGGWMPKLKAWLNSCNRCYALHLYHNCGIGR